MERFEFRDGDLNLKLVRAFLATEATGSFAQAARSLCLSQSVLSRAIADLEARVGDALFFRSRGKLVLTVAGHVFLPYAKKLLAAHAELATGIATWRAQQAGKLRLVCSDAVLPALLPRLLETMGSATVDKALEFADASSSDVIASVVGGDYDLGICLHLEALPITVASVALAQVPLGVLSAPDLPLPEVIASFEDIAGIPIAFHQEDSVVHRALLMNLPDPTRFKPPAIVSMNIAAMYAMVTSARVAALTVATCTCHPIAKDLVFRPITGFRHPLQISAIYPSKAFATPPDLLSLVGTAFMQLPWHPSVTLFRQDL